MKKTSFSAKWIWVLFLSFACLQAEASTRVGNGGAGWICREKSDSNVIRWLTVVDLFEARFEFGLSPAPLFEADEWSLAASKIALVRAQAPGLAPLLTSLESIRQALVILPKEVTLEQIDDGAIRIRPSPMTCPNGYLYYCQIANFTNDGRLLVNGEAWNDPAFGVAGRGALLVHEVIYKALRENFGDRTSVRARAIVGLLFSNIPMNEQKLRIEKVLAAKPDWNDSETADGSL